MHEYSANDAGVQRMETELAGLEAFVLSERMRLLDKIVMRDEAMMRRFAEVFRNDGEIAAFYYIEDELLRLSADAAFDPCGTRSNNSS